MAVKVIAVEGQGGAPARAEREARVAAKLNHPGIVALYELGTDEQAVYIVSELVRGRTFGELLNGGGLSDRDVARIGIALCDALAHAHAKGVIHRDVKPQNVMVVARARRRGRASQSWPTSAWPTWRAATPSRARATWWARSPTWRPSRRRASASPPRWTSTRSR